MHNTLKNSRVTMKGIFCGWLVKICWAADLILLSSKHKSVGQQIGICKPQI